MKTHTKKQRELRNTLIGWLLVMPSLIFMAAFTVWPVFRSIWLSLTKYKLGMSAPEFIGLKNYISLAGSSLFWKVMGNTLFFALITIVPSMVVGLFLATLVNRKSRLIGFVRTSYFYPVVMPMIAIASIWMFIYMAKNGLLDQMLISNGPSAYEYLIQQEDRSSGYGLYVRLERSRIPDGILPFRYPEYFHRCK